MRELCVSHSVPVQIPRPASISRRLFKQSKRPCPIQRDDAMQVGRPLENTRNPFLSNLRICA